MVLCSQRNEISAPSKVLPSRPSLHSLTMLLPKPKTPLKCFCGRAYTSSDDLEEHRKARGHFPSHKCTSSCKHPATPPQDGQIRVCGYCGKLCERLDIFQDHAIATGHCFCSDCDLHFPSRQCWEDHRNSAVHASEFKCCDCDSSFQDVHALVAHMESRVHRKRCLAKVARNNRKHIPSTRSSTDCTKCRKKFSCLQSLQQHYASLKHKPLSRLKCPIGSNCKGTFLSPSALLHHLESGSCSSGMHRGKVHQIVESCDLNILSHSPSASAACTVSAVQAYTPYVGGDIWATTPDTGSEWSLLTPATSSGSAEESLEQWSLLEDAEPRLEGGSSPASTTLQTLRCPMCPSKQARFLNLHSLQQHMDSPAHTPKVYQCPSLGQVGDITRHARYFSTLGGLCQHLESDSCQGGKSALFQCIAFIQAQLKQLGLREVQLLLPHLQT
jgi:hypothetical protein